MKTSIIVSSIAALCLMLNFAEAPSRHSEKNAKNTSSTENISYITVKMLSMLPGVEITANRTKTAELRTPVTTAGDYSYLRFNLTNYIGSEAFTPDNTESMPDLSETVGDYLKFEVAKYSSESEMDNVEITELPESSATDFEYLKFDVNKYVDNSNPTATELEELPADDFSYLKFDVNRFYNPDQLDTVEPAELSAY